MGIFGNFAGALGNLGGVIAPINPGLGGALLLVGQIGNELDGKDPKVKIDPNPLFGADLFDRYRPLWGIPRGSEGFGVGPFSTATVGANIENRKAYPETLGRIQLGTLLDTIERIQDAQRRHRDDWPRVFAQSEDVRPDSYKSWRSTHIYAVIARHPRSSGGDRMHKPYPVEVPADVAEAFRWKDTGPFGSGFNVGKVKDWFDDHKKWKVPLVLAWQQLHDLADELHDQEEQAWLAHAESIRLAEAKAEAVAIASAQAALDFEAFQVALANGTYTAPGIGSILPPLTIAGQVLSISSADSPAASPPPPEVLPATVAAGGLGLLLLLL